jgi:hypothetical protein
LLKKKKNYKKIKQLSKLNLLKKKKNVKKNNYGLKIKYLENTLQKKLIKVLSIPISIQIKQNNKKLKITKNDYKNLFLKV